MVVGEWWKTELSYSAASGLFSDEMYRIIISIGAKHPSEYFIRNANRVLNIKSKSSRVYTNIRNIYEISSGLSS